jgi:hypothetical protein
MKYKTEDGELIQGNSPIDIVRALRDGGRFTADQSDDEYMNGFAKRWKEYSGHDIRFDSAENFVNDLVNTGGLIPV